MTDSWFLFELSLPEAEVQGAILLRFCRSMPFLAAATAKAHTLMPPPCRQSARHAACEPSYIRGFPDELQPKTIAGLLRGCITSGGLCQQLFGSFEVALGRCRAMMPLEVASMRVAASDPGRPSLSPKHRPSVSTGIVVIPAPSRAVLRHCAKF